MKITKSIKKFKYDPSKTGDYYNAEEQGYYLSESDLIKLLKKHAIKFGILTQDWTFLHLDKKKQIKAFTKLYDKRILIKPNKL